MPLWALNLYIWHIPVLYDSAYGGALVHGLEHGIPAGTAWEDVPMNWTCPECGARKEDFEMVPT